MMKAQKKTCFFIAPIGEEGSESRKWSDKVLNYIVAPAIRSLGYQKPERSDTLSIPGSITLDIIHRLVEYDLVIADLTGRNPNVYYELAIRHASQKPVVHLIREGEDIPFDLKDSRTIKISDDIAKSKVIIQSLRNQIKESEKAPMVYTPITIYAKLKSLSETKEPIEEKQALFELLTEFHSAISGIDARIADLDKIINDIKGDVQTIKVSSLPSPFVERRLAKLDLIKYKAQQKGYIKNTTKDS
ncbi:MAG: hypothetical protein HOP27_13160 [Anaerolineales bacterium]|nr:hypothetical protein [Anaerolineales bacterium]